MLGAGLAAREIATVLELDLDTIYKGIAAAKGRLEARTATEAVARAIRSGQVAPPKV